MSVFVYGQISIDTINKTIDTTALVRKKIEKVFTLSRGRLLSEPDLQFIRSKMLQIAKSSSVKSDEGFAYYQFALLYSNQKKPSEAIKNYFEALKIAEPTKDSALISKVNLKLALSFKELNNINYSIKYLYKAIRISCELKNNKECADIYNLLGTIFKDQNAFDSALYYNKKALEIRLKLGDKKGLAITYNNIGLVYKKQKNYEPSIIYLEKALTLRKEIGDKIGIAGTSINIGNVLMQQKKFKIALDYIYEGTLLARTTKEPDFYRTGLNSLGNCYYELKEYRHSADYRLKYKEAKDSIGAEEISKQISELSAQYETEKKDVELKLQEQQIKLKTEQNNKQKILTLVSVIALILALVAIVFVYRSFRLNKKNAEQLAVKNKLIEEKNKEITDSINYARIIQNSLLAPQILLDNNLKDYFILYKPKDIVSGDFYWAAESVDAFTIACVDCTGHGVPGAFMSLIGKENLDKAHAKTNSPHKILSELNKNVKISLNQNAIDGTKDGMDAVIVKMEKSGHITTLTYSGANRPLWIIRKNTLEVEEIKATKHAIGGHTSNEQVFEEHCILLYPGDSFFIFTDGYADQFGGNKQKKITTKLFKDVLVKNRMTNISGLKKILDTYLHDWKGKNEQIDDILIIGIKV